MKQNKPVGRLGAENRLGGKGLEAQSHGQPEGSSQGKGGSIVVTTWLAPTSKRKEERKWLLAVDTFLHICDPFVSLPVLNALARRVK